MNIKAATGADTRWEYMSKVLSCFKNNCFKVLAYLDQNKCTEAPTLYWWIVLMFIQKLPTKETQIFRNLEEYTTMESQQFEVLQHLHDIYKHLLDTSGPLSAEEQMPFIWQLKSSPMIVSLCLSFQMSQQRWRTLTYSFKEILKRLVQTR